MQETLQQTQFDKIPNLKQEWLKGKPYIIEALKYQDLYAIEDVECKIKDGTFLLWTGKQSAIITEFIEFPQKKTCNLLFCGGDFNEIVEITKTIEDFCHLCGVSKLYGGGRRGWLRKIKHLGWKPDFLIYKDLNDV